MPFREQGRGYCANKCHGECRDTANWSANCASDNQYDNTDEEQRLRGSWVDLQLVDNLILVTGEFLHGRMRNMRRNLFWIVAVAWLVFLPKLAAASGDIDVVQDIDLDEYAVYRVALANLKGVLDIPAAGNVILDATFSGRLLDAPTIAHLARSDMVLDLVMIDDFNRKNAVAHRIAKGHLPPSFILSNNWTPLLLESEESVERLEVSRVGFDKERTRAILLVTYTLRSRRDAYHNTGGYLMMERTGSQWTVSGRALGWSRFY